MRFGLPKVGGRDSKRGKCYVYYHRKGNKKVVCGKESNLSGQRLCVGKQRKGKVRYDGSGCKTLYARLI